MILKLKNTEFNGKTTQIEVGKLKTSENVVND
jgi:hypothetical protein